MLPRNDFVDHFLRCTGLDPDTVNLADYLRDYIAEFGSDVTPMLNAIRENVPSAKEMSVRYCAGRLILGGGLLQEKDALPFFLMLEQLCALAGDKDDAGKNFILHTLKDATKTLSDAGLSMLTFVHPEPENLRAFRDLCSSQDAILADIVKHDFNEHLAAYLELFADQCNPEMAGYLRYPENLVRDLRPLFYNGPLPTPEQKSRAVFFGNSSLSNEEIYHRCVVNITRSFVSDAKPVEIPILSPAFISTYGAMITREIISHMTTYSRYGIGIEGSAKVRLAVNHLSTQGLDFLYAFACSAERGRNPATAEHYMDKIDSAEELHQLLLHFEYPKGAKHYAGVIFSDLLMDNLPKELAVQALRSDTMLTRRYEHTGDTYFLNFLQNNDKLNDVLGADLGL
jgi:hypothetical protein